MAKRQVFYGEFHGVDDYLDRLRELNADIPEIVTDALEQAADNPTTDTIAAMKPQFMPAKGKYWTGNTADTIIRKPTVTWQNTVASIGIGFDKEKNGVGTLLITGTPRMKPNRKLEQIYARKATVKKFQETVDEVIQNAIEDLEG